MNPKVDVQPAQFIFAMHVGPYCSLWEFSWGKDGIVTGQVHFTGDQASDQVGGNFQPNGGLVLVRYPTGTNGFQNYTVGQFSVEAEYQQVIGTFGNPGGDSYDFSGIAKRLA